MFFISISRMSCLAAIYYLLLGAEPERLGADLPGDAEGLWDGDAEGLWY